MNNTTETQENQTWEPVSQTRTSAAVVTHSCVRHVDDDEDDDDEFADPGILSPTAKRTSTPVAHSAITMLTIICFGVHLQRWEVSAASCEVPSTRVLPHGWAKFDSGFGVHQQGVRGLPATGRMPSPPAAVTRLI